MVARCREMILKSQSKLILIQDEKDTDKVFIDILSKSSIFQVSQEVQVPKKRCQLSREGRDVSNYSHSLGRWGTGFHRKEKILIPLSKCFFVMFVGVLDTVLHTPFSPIGGFCKSFCWRRCNWCRTCTRRNPLFNQS